MNIAGVFFQSATIKALADQGAIFIKALRVFLDSTAPLPLGGRVKLAEHLRVLHESPHRLRVSFYGLVLEFRIEIPFENTEVKPGRPLANLAAYRLSYDKEPTEQSLGVRCFFDKLGNVTIIFEKDGKEYPQDYLQNEFRAPFLEAVFTGLAAAKGTVLIPE